MQSPVAASVIQTALSAAEPTLVGHIKGTLAEIAKDTASENLRSHLFAIGSASDSDIPPPFLDRLDDSICFLSLLEIALQGHLIEKADLPSWLGLGQILKGPFAEYYKYIRPSPLVQLLEDRIIHGRSRQLDNAEIDFDPLFSRLAAFTRQLGRCHVRRVAASIESHGDGISWEDIFSLLDDPDRLAQLAIAQLEGPDAVAGEYYFALRDFIAASIEFDSFLHELRTPELSSACFFVNERWFSFGRDRAQAALVVTVLKWREYSKSAITPGSYEPEPALDSATSALEALKRLASTHYRYPLDTSAYQFGLYRDATSHQIPWNKRGPGWQSETRASASVRAVEPTGWKLALQIVETVILTSPTPVPTWKLLEVLGDQFERRAIYRILEDLATEYLERPLELVEVATGWQLQTRSYLRSYIEKTRQEKPPRYSRATLETLAIIAYRQPVTRGDIEDIRGVSVSGELIKQLEERSWIEVVGHRESPGRPGLYATTSHFLDDLGLQSIDQLPTIEGLFPEGTTAASFVSPTRVERAPLLNPS